MRGVRFIYISLNYVKIGEIIYHVKSPLVAVINSVELN